MITAQEANNLSNQQNKVLKYHLEQIEARILHSAGLGSLKVKYLIKQPIDTLLQSSIIWALLDAGYNYESRHIENPFGPSRLEMTISWEKPRKIQT